MSIDKEKLKHVPINLFLGLPAFFILSMLNENDKISLFISLTIFINQVITESKFDYLEEQIKKL